MAYSADDWMDRRRLRRKVTFWRAVSLIGAGLAVLTVSAWLFGDDYAGRSVDHIAKVRIEGTITEEEELLERLETIRTSSRVKGVLLVIDSPGGTTAGGEAIYEAVRKLAREKPVVAQVGTLAASAGYMIASAADHIVARQSSIVGSIGVLVQFPNFTGLLQKAGIEVEEVKSTPLKAEPSPFNVTTEEERAMLRAMILDSYDWFVGIVDERRPLSRAETLALANGAVFTGRQALQRKLVDALGGEAEAAAWLTGKGLPSLEILEWKPDSSDSGLLFASAMARGLLEALGMREIGVELSRALGAADPRLANGLVSLWRPAGALAQ